MNNVLARYISLSAFLLLLCISTKSYCQIPEVMVGDTSKIGIFFIFGGQYQACTSIEFSLTRNLNTNFSYNTLHPSMWQLGHSDTDEVLFAPKTIGVQNDSAIFWSFWRCSPAGHLFYYADSIRYQFTAKGIDSVVVIKPKDPTIIFPIDTQASKYKSKLDPFYFYSNIADSVLFDSWQLVVDPSAKIIFTVDSNSNVLSEYRSKPFTRKKQLNFTFTTALPPTDTAHSFPATMKTRVRYKGVDSIYSNNFSILLPAAPKNDVRNNSRTDLSLTINPNPFSKLTTFIVTTSNSEPVTLEIYDLLGNRKAVITNGEYVSGIRDFHFDATSFTAGSYFARLVSPGQVITRKIIVE